MQRKLPIVVALVFLLSCLLGWAATQLGRLSVTPAAAAERAPARIPRVRQVTLDRATVPRYERLEIRIDLDGRFQPVRPR
jgi:hypothetical protein